MTIIDVCTPACFWNFPRTVLWHTLVLLFLALPSLAVIGCVGGESSDLSLDTAVPSAQESTVPQMPVSNLERGETIYVKLCAACHGENGMGRTGEIPPLSGSKIVAEKPDWVVRIVMHGLRGRVTVKAQDYDAVMPALWELDDKDIAAVTTYARDRFGDEASPVSREMVAALRATTEGRREAWTIRELRATPVDFDSLTTTSPPARTE